MRLWFGIAKHTDVLSPLFNPSTRNAIRNLVSTPPSSEWVRQGAQTLSPTLAMALINPSSGLASDQRFAPFLHGGNGHRIVYKLAAAADHPLLTAQGTPSPEPRQRPDQSLITYLNNWIQFLKFQLLVGIVYADRYFINRIMAGMNPSLRAQLDPEISDRRNMVGYSDPFPDALQPGALLSTFQQHAVTLSHPEYLHTSPRAIKEASQAVRSLKESDNFSDANVRAIGFTRSCVLCSDPSHVLRECPYKAKLQEPGIRKIIGLPALTSTSTQVRTISSVADQTKAAHDLDLDHPALSGFSDGLPMETLSPIDTKAIIWSTHDDCNTTPEAHIIPLSSRVDILDRDTPSLVSPYEVETVHSICKNDVLVNSFASGDSTFDTFDIWDGNDECTVFDAYEKMQSCLR